LEALGLKRGDYIVKLNNRKLLDGVLEAGHRCCKIVSAAASCCARSTSSTGLGVEGRAALLGEGRKDESGDFTKGRGPQP
jgi:histidyl-tRNA synthetase